MFQNSGLSLDQAPPIGVVFRFFLAGSLFGIAAGVWLMFHGVEALDPSASAGLILTHLLTLGVMLSFMLGALFQMLPVLAGVAHPRPMLRALRTQYPQIFGTIFLLLGFEYGDGILYALAALFLTIALLPTAGWMLRRLVDLPSHSASSRGMGFALFDLLILLLLGLSLLGMRSGMDLGDYAAFRSLHIAYGLLGWIALLILSVSFQVIEMFYVTPAYPRLLSRYLPVGIAAALTLELVARLDLPPLAPWIENLALLGILAYALLTLRRLSQRRRPLTDATVWFWRTGMGALSIASILWILRNLLGGFPAELDRLLFGLYGAFALSVVFAMSYKIVPFLSWFHLNAQGYFNAPMMHEVIRPRYAMQHLGIHLATLFVALVAAFDPRLWPLVGAMLTLSFAWIALAIYRAWHLYLEVQRTGERFEFGKC